MKNLYSVKAKWKWF